MTKRQQNIEKAQQNGYRVEKLGSMWFVNDEHGDCHGYFGTERKAFNALALKGSYYA